MVTIINNVDDIFGLLDRFRAQGVLLILLRSFNPYQLFSSNRFQAALIV